MKYKNLYPLRKLGLAASLALFTFSAHAQVTDQDVVDDLPDLENGTFIIGATGAFDVIYNSSITVWAYLANSSLTFQNDSDYTASNDDIILHSADGFTPTLNISSGIIDLGTSNGEITGKATFFGGNGTSYVNITGGMVNMRRFKADGEGSGNVNLIVNISGSGTSVYSNDSDANVNDNDTIDVTVSDGAIYSLSGTGSAFGIKNYTIEDGGTLESRGTWTLSSLDSFIFESGGTLQLGGVVSGLTSITSGQTVVLDGGSFGDATTLNGGTLQTGAFDMTNLTFSSGTLETTGVLTNLGTLSSGQTVILDGGSFGDATTLNGGTLQTAAFDLTNLTFTSGTLEVTGALTNLNTTSAGQSVVLDGGTWSPSGNIDAGNTTIQNSGSLSVGDLDATNLTFTSGTLNAAGTLTNLNTTSAGQTVILDGGTWSPTGSIDAGNTTIQNNGSLSVGDLDATNLTFTSGTLNAAGTLTNLNTTSAGQTVILDGGTWSPSGNIDAGDTTIQNSGSLSVGDLDATNLTFTSGTLNASGTLTNLNTTSAGQTVILDGGTWSPSGNIDAGNTTIQNSGSLSVGDLDATNLTFTSGTLEATGVLTNLGSLHSGQTVILDGGSFGDTTTLDTGSLLKATDLDAGNLNFQNGTIEVTGALTNLDNLTISSQVVNLDGGTWSPSGNIDAGTTTILNGGALTVSGDLDASRLTLSGGSLLVNGADLSNLADITSGNEVTLTGGGVLLTATTLDGGILTGGNFDLDSNLTFTSGTLNVSGTLQNLSHLPSGTAVNMSGASADLILSQDLVITGGTLNIDNGASVTVLNDVTLGAGLIGFDSSGGVLDMDGGVLNVASMDTDLTLNANASIAGNGSIYGDVSLGTDGTIAGDATGLTVFGRVGGSGNLSNVTIYGTLAPGNSPGVMNVTGDHEFTAPSTTEMELAGSGGVAGTDFDQFNVSGTLTLGGTLNIIPFSAYELVGGNTYDLFNAGTFTGDFASVSVYGTDLSLSSNEWTGQTASLAYSFSQADGNLNVTAIPEPGTILMFACFGLAAVIGLRRR